MLQIQRPHIDLCTCTSASGTTLWSSGPAGKEVAVDQLNIQNRASSMYRLLPWPLAIMVHGFAGGSGSKCRSCIQCMHLLRSCPEFLLPASAMCNGRTTGFLHSIWMCTQIMQCLHSFPWAVQQSVVPYHVYAPCGNPSSVRYCSYTTLALA